MRIVFLHSGREFDGDSLDHQALGGTETALISTAKALAANPDLEVWVFAGVAAPAVFSRVHYAPLTRFHGWAISHPVDVLISIRMWLPFWLPVRAGLRVYFSPDAHDQPFLRKGFDVATRSAGNIQTVPLLAPDYFLDDVDAVFCVGQWQADQFVSQLGFPRAKIFVTANGVRLANFGPRPLAERHRRLLYSSTPFRGLLHLVRYFPEIRARSPGAELEICSSMQVYGLSAAEDESLYGTLYSDARKLGAISHGSVRQAKLASIMCRDRVYAYPNVFAETFCISVLEAQAAGLPVVTTKKAGLVERVASGVDGFLIDGDPGEPSYDREFIDRTVLLLANDDVWRCMSAASIRKARQFTYERVADSWLEYFRDRLQGVDPQLPTVDLDALRPFAARSTTDSGVTITVGSAELKSLVNRAFTKFFGPPEPDPAARGS